ncbi:histidine kinase [Bacillus pinisoli]|uniref:histidine kinase n=1 Tax=Bacillus pinisoli TaxID=2901866 RepID=UPI001FF450ED|nr:histidine kinase [Bacillus pinisoli]
MSSNSFILISFIIIFLGVFAAFLLFRRAQHSKIWLIAASVTQGLSITCMHFVGMLTIHNHDITYNVDYLHLSIITSILFSYVGLFLIKIGKERKFVLVLGGLTLGLGVYALHVMALEAIAPVTILYHINGTTLFFGALLPFTLTGLVFYGQRAGTVIKRSLVGSLLFSIGTITLHYYSMASIHAHQFITNDSDITESTAVVLGIIYSIILILMMVLLYVAYLDRKYAEKVAENTTVEEANAHLTTILESIQNGIAVFSANGDITFINELGKKILSLSDKEIAGKKFHSPLWDFYLPNGEPVAFDQRLYNLIKQTKRSISNYELIYQKKFQHPVLLTMNGSPYFNKAGEVQEVIISFSDITEKRSQEIELFEKKSKIEAMYKNTSFGILLLDFQATILEANPVIEEMLGFSIEELNEKSQKYFFKKVFPAAMKKLLPKGQFFQIEQQFSHKDGSPRWGKLTISLISLSESDAEPYILCIAEDTTKAREMEISHLLKDAELRVLQSQIHPHFLFNTLNSIVSLIRVQPDCARHITVQLANYMRLNVQHTEVDLVPLSKELEHLQAYLEIITIRFGEKIKIVVDGLSPDDYKDVFIPPFTLQPLVENSIEHGLSTRREGGVISISLTPKNGGIEASIKDNGTGIKDEIIKQLGHVRVSSKDGNGVGVYNVNQRLVMLLGGESGLAISSEEGRGTSITFFLPIKNERMEAV